MTEEEKDAYSKYQFIKEKDNQVEYLTMQLNRAKKRIKIREKRIAELHKELKVLKS